MDYSRHPRLHPPARVLRRTMRRPAHRPASVCPLLVVAGIVAFATGCADTFTPSSAAHADQLFEGIATRFSTNVYDGRYNVARLKLAQSALVPSRIFNDSSVWSTERSGSIRFLYVNGTPGTDGKYRFDARPTLLPLVHPGDSRHAIALEQVGSNQFRWDTRVELAIGAITPDEVATALEALLRAPEGRTERALRDDYRAAFPHAMAAFGRGFALDSVTIAPSAAGATNVALRFVFHPELMKSSFPGLTGYLDKYLGPAKYHFLLTDRSGATLFDVIGRDRAMSIRYRIAQGKLVSLLGPPKAWPDSLTLLSDISLKVKIFTVGVHELSTDFVISNMTSGNTRERAWNVIAQHEPKWDLPLITERLLRSPLRRPFEGQGSMFRLWIRDSTGAQTVFGRRARLEVQESPIMRFIGSLASHALGDLDARVEQDEHRFMREGFVALQTDLRALSRRPGDEPSETEKRR